MHTLILMMALMQTKAATPVQKYYITGLAHTATANDCTIPAIVTYGSSRLDALTHCCEGGGLTIWTEAEYSEMRQTIGKEFDASCAESKSKPEPIDVPAQMVDIPLDERSSCGPIPCDLKTHTCSAVCTPPSTQRIGCKDATRILMHDEQTPPKWYCHKVQTQ